MADWNYGGTVPKRCFQLSHSVDAS
jgi:hypothetical protein